MARRFPGRTTVKLILHGPGETRTAVFLKRYQSDYLSLSRKLLRVIRWPTATDEAWREWSMLHELRARNIGTARPVAVGQEKALGNVVRSFVMTEEIAGGEPGDRFCEQLDFIERREFAKELGALARKFHGSGFVHKDFYLGHIFVVRENGRRHLRVIDLQRVTRPLFFKGRWRTKDLSALAYSALNSGMSNTDLLRIFEAYLQTQKLNFADKQLVRKIVDRVAWLRTRRPKHDDLPASANQPP